MLKKIMAERIHPYFTASPLFPANPAAAFEDGKNRLKSTLSADIKILETISLADYCRMTGSTITEV